MSKQHEGLEWLDEILSDYREAYFYADNQAKTASRPRTVDDAEKIAKGADTVAKQSIAQKVREICEAVIGEDEWHQDTSFGGALPKFQTTSQAYRNSLREEQRKALEAQLQGGGDE